MKELNSAWLATAIEHSVDAIITIDNRGSMTSVNAATVRLFGYQKQELLGQNVRVLMPEPDKSRHDTYINNYVETGTAKIIGIGREVQAKKKDGRIFWCLLSISETNVEGEVIFTGVLHDISNIKETERKMKLLNEQLEERVEERTEKLTEAVNQLLRVNKDLNGEIALRKATENALKNSQLDLSIALEKEKELGDLKSNFVTLASHEFRTPLSTILSSANLVKRYINSEQQDQREKHLSKINNSVHQLNDILNDFLSLSKMEEGKMPIHIEPLNIASEINAVIENIQPYLKQGQSIEIVQSKSNDLMLADKHMLKNVLTNLISNASKYSDRNKEICIKWSNDTSDNNVLNIAIIDDGMGIPVEDQKNLFQRFFRAKNSLNIDGTGLGLHLVQAYVKHMNGSVTFKSKLNKGSTFIISLPKHQK